MFCSVFLSQLGRSCHSVRKDLVIDKDKIEKEKEQGKKSIIIFQFIDISPNSPSFSEKDKQHINLSSGKTLDPYNFTAQVHCKI